MASAFWIPFGASLIAALVTTSGIYTIRHLEEWGRRYSIYFVCFAAGVLIAVSFLHIIPTAIGMTPSAPIALLGGFLLLHLFNRFITAFVCEQGPDSRYGLGLIPTLGIGLHSLIDGVVYAVTFSVGLFTGTLAALGMVLHEFPEGIVTYVMLLRGGFSERAALGLALLAAAVSTPLGTLISYPVIQRIDASTLGVLLALSAGALLYVGASHLLPQAEREHRKYSLYALAAGILVAILIVLAK